MWYKVIVSCVGISICSGYCVCQDSTTCTDGVCTTTTSVAKEEAHEREVQKMAIETLASMANSIINIGADAHNPEHVGKQVISILSNFVNFVTFALRDPQILELLEKDEFRGKLKSILTEEILEKILQEVGNEIPQKDRANQACQQGLSNAS